MKQRQYGTSDLRLSEIGMGGHREGVETLGGLARTARFFLSAQERARVVGQAIDLGVSYFDTTFGCEIASLGESLRLLKRRDGLFVSGMRVDYFANYLAEGGDLRAYTRREVEGRLREFGFERMEQFLMGAMEAGDPLAHPRSLLEDAFAELETLRDEGKIRFFGFSCHNPDYAARLLDAFPRFDAAMVPYNWENRAAEGALAQAVARHGAAWIAMKPLVWRVYGVPVTVLRRFAPGGRDVTWDPRAPIARLALQFLLQNPLLTTCVPAMNTVEAVDENASASGREPLTPDEGKALTAYAEGMGAHGMELLAIAGLLDGNLRVCGNALNLARSALGAEVPEIDWAADDAKAQARAAADAVLHGRGVMRAVSSVR